MAQFMISYGVWMWLALAAVLMTLEVVVPGVHFLWFGVAAAIVALLAWVTPFGWEWQLVVFGMLSLLTVFYGRQLGQAANSAATDAPSLNERGHQYIGRTVVVEEAIQGGRGRVRVGDTVWQAEGPNLPAGARVTVKSVNGTVLVVA
jgi:inner membrane protein